MISFNIVAFGIGVITLIIVLLIIMIVVTVDNEQGGKKQKKGSRNFGFSDKKIDIDRKDKK